MFVSFQYGIWYIFFGQMITSLIEMVEFQGFGLMTTSTIQFESHGKVSLVTLWKEIMMS